MSGGVPGHQLLGESEKVAESCPELPCCVSVTLLASSVCTTAPLAKVMDRQSVDCRTMPTKKATRPALKEAVELKR
ncbi:hypothetical protein F2P81_018331 [Scophthalmus maximus]|uniref:Uncharacterized protein n=1 Tax=Scophthalmus maximus TaxID=52904 RepID=A0A6A4S1Y2_SCOMX|nr:hypothetical protein F2P81_018331 [Scophthalmus maximus]